MDTDGTYSKKIQMSDDLRKEGLKLENNSILAEVNALLEELAMQLKEPVLKSSTRMLIIITLSINKRLSFTELLQLTSTGKGSLSNHIDKLQESGLVRTKMAFRLSGPRLIIEITKTGLEIYEKYTRLLKKLLSLENGVL